MKIVNRLTDLVDISIQKYLIFNYYTEGRFKQAEESLKNCYKPDKIVNLIKKDINGYSFLEKTFFYFKVLSPSPSDNTLDFFAGKKILEELKS